MLRKAIDIALTNPLLVLGGALVLFVWGIISFHALPIEAYPDVADTYAQVITQWPGHAAEEVEQQITVPLEVELNGVAHLTHLRSVSLMGLSVITIIYDDEIPTINARQEVLDRLQSVTLPTGVTPGIGPDYSPVGQIMFYTLTSTNPNYDVMELKALNDWFVVNQLKSVPNVVDVNPFGGPTREYQVQLDPGKLVAFGLALPQVEQALVSNNINAGGGFIERGEQALNVRAVGLMQTTDDIGATVVKVQNGTPVRVRDLGNVVQAPKVRLGQLGKTIHKQDGTILNDDDVVEGIVLLRKGAVAETTLATLHQKIDELNGVNGENGLLPAGVKLVPHLDRSELMHHTTHTVLRNLTDGVVLVTLILFLFLGNVRSALIVAITIPFSLLFAAILLDLRHIPANLLSLGALDFGMVVDGSVVMVENILRHTSFGDHKRSFREIDRLRRRTKCRSQSFSPASSLLFPICRSSRCSASKAACSGRWRGRSPLPCSVRWCSPCSSRPCSAVFFSAARSKNGAIRCWSVSIATMRASLDWCFDHMKLTLGMGLSGFGER